MSSASTGTACRSVSWFRCDTKLAIGPSIARSRPIPNKPSIIKSQWLKGISTTCCWFTHVAVLCWARARLCCASSECFSLTPYHSRFTSNPSCESRYATSKASPPLSPAPASTKMRPCDLLSSCKAKRDAARPAARIKAPTGKTFFAAISISRIC